MTMKNENFNAVHYRVNLTYKEGSMESATVDADDVATVMMIARGWLLSSVPLGSSVWYCPIDRNGECIGVGSQYVL